MITQRLTLRRTPWTVCGTCGEVIDNLDRCGCDYKRAQGAPAEEVPTQGYDLALFPWEDIELVIADAEAIFEEMESKPGLGVEPGYDPSLDFEALLAEVQTTGGWVTASPATLASFDAEPIGEHFARHPWLY